MPPAHTPRNRPSFTAMLQKNIRKKNLKAKQRRVSVPSAKLVA